jgi:PIN domain nuclease of toxin-antitoxin system
MAGCVLDASAVLAWIFDEHGARTVEKVLAESALSTVNLAEVLYRCDEEGMRTDQLEQDLMGLGLSVVSFEVSDARLAQEVRRAGRREGVRLALGDCCCLATGIRLNVPVVGGDQAWERLRPGVDVHPFR